MVFENARKITENICESIFDKIVLTKGKMKHIIKSQQKHKNNQDCQMNKNYNGGGLNGRV